MRSRSTSRGTALAVMVVTAMVGAVMTHPIGARAQQDPRPNIVVIMTDDQRWNMTETMPFSVAEIGRKGITFRRTIVTNPLCCPSRASFYSGEYSHTNGVWSNGDAGEPQGGWNAFKPHESDTVATWLSGAGYQTGLFGKYLNNYDGSTIPPGWDRWVAFAAGTRYYDYDLTDQGTIEHYGDRPSDYSTDVLTDHAVEFIASTAEDPRPMFLVLTPFAAHGPMTPAPRHEDAPVSVRFPTNAAIGEANVRDKPRWVRRLPPLSRSKVARLMNRAERQARTVMAVDESIARIMEAMEGAGRSNTMYVLFADQGIAWGEHRWQNKLDPYEMSIRQLLMVRWDGHIVPGVRYDGLVQHIDLTATFASLAGVSPTIDGISLEPVFDGEGTIRDHTLTEGFHVLRGKPPTYCVIRTDRFKYVRYATGEQEFYDLEDDPFELRNRVYYGLGTKVRSLAYQEMVGIADEECVVEVRG